MKVYVDIDDTRKITTYHDGLGTQQGLYVYGKDKIEVLSLSDYTKQVRKEVCEEIAQKMANKLVRMQPDGEFGTRLAIDWYDVNKVLDQIQGE